MLFNTFDFALFLPLVFLLYWFPFAKNVSQQNKLLLVASYYFYSNWDWRFLFLLMFSTLLDYFCGILIEKSTSNYKRKFWFWLSIIVNLGILVVFKYYNFFAESFADAFRLFGRELSLSTLEIILPIGISFYTFHGLSYIIDIYRRKINAESNFVDYAVFVSFFPLLVAGPIERATHLLPQIKKPRFFETALAKEGLKQILWGLVKKVIIADQCAQFANEVFDNAAAYNGSALLLGAVFFAFQIYGDFSGYSDIALGTAKLFGFSLLRNFNYPYFSRDIAEFWRRWHISLSSWFKDYLYIPLGGNKGPLSQTILNTFIIFIVSGFWHGANFTYIFWGFLNALYFLPLLVRGIHKSNLEIASAGKFLPTIKELFQISLTFGLTCIAWIFFRAETITEAFSYLLSIFNKTLFSIPNFKNNIYALGALVVIGLFMLVEWVGREIECPLYLMPAKYPSVVRWGVYYFLCLAVILLAGKQQEFIYFQF
jgi:D-alanyl-lipoteichoic acid acyltransferase DltB (MBOAT superfamily)